MSICGIGTDLVEIARIQAALDRHGERFAQRILAQPELAEWASRGRSARLLAKRFAAKEAAAKALGCGFRDGVRMADIRVVHDELGKPGLDFAGGAAARLQALEVGEAALSISDERAYALAFVVLTRR